MYYNRSLTKQQQPTKRPRLTRVHDAPSDKVLVSSSDTGDESIDSEDIEIESAVRPVMDKMFAAKFQESNLTIANVKSIIRVSIIPLSDQL